VESTGIYNKFASTSAYFITSRLFLSALRFTADYLGQVYKLVSFRASLKQPVNPVQNSIC